jgi:hypothetical protein
MLDTWFSYGVHGCTTEGILCQNLPFFQLMNSLVILLRRETRRFSAVLFIAHIPSFYETRAVARLSKV